MLFLTLFQITVFLLYVAYVTKRFGVLDSLSESWYLLERGNPLFTLFCLGIGLPMFFQSTGHSTFFFLAGIGLVSIGIVALYEKAFKRCLHYSGTTAAVIGTILGIMCDSGVWWPLPALIVSALAISFWKGIENKIWWTEMATFTILSASLLMR